MKRRSLWLLPIVIIFAIACKSTGISAIDNPAAPELIRVEYPEVYELANIVLALTDYGITDKWQVRKDFAYYEEMRAYFQPYQDHPLLDSVNFSREKWQEYLSYRTDAYAFAFDQNNRLARSHDFSAFDIQIFDQYLDLTEDFAETSNFRAFFAAHRDYYQEIVDNYRKAYLLTEMKAFLGREFGDYFADKQYAIVISPFVYAQNLHRDIDSNWTADFPTVAKPIIEAKGFDRQEDKSTEIHTLFTEMDHGYVNPTTDQYPVAEQFNEALWDVESGYAGSGQAVFNEYMTWAVFDLFNAIHFPEIAAQINLNWHFQNDSRGFIYSHLFAAKLKALYEQYDGKKPIKELYPELLSWTSEVQADLSKPILLNDSDTLRVEAQPQTINLQFSEPMEKVAQFDVVLQLGQWEKEVVRIESDHHIQWDNSGRSLSFDLELPDKEAYYLLLNWWGVEKPIVSQKGIMLTAASGLVVRGNGTGN